jgi:hypothetical protein
VTLWSGRQASPKDSTNFDSEIDLNNILNPKIRRTEVFTHALSLISSLQSASSCNRLAAITLLDSCGSLESSMSSETYDGITDLDQIKSIYAARLAICELVGANTGVPIQCSPLLPNKPRRNQSVTRSFQSSAESSKTATGPSVWYDPVSEKQLGQCLKTLETRPQWWTSYSNSKQNAVTMCQAARHEIEKGMGLFWSCTV